MSARVVVAILTVGFCGCDHLTSGFRNEMREMASRQGLALGCINGSALQVLPAGGGPPGNELLENRLGPRQASPGWFSPDGRFVVWELSWPFAKPDDPSLIVQTLTGTTVATWYGQLNTVVALALSPDKSRAAIEVQNYYPKAPATGLQYVVLGTGKRVVIEAMPPQNEADASDSLGWSPDSRRIVFSRGHKVIVLNTETGVRATIADGTQPAWSPDGRWISFTSIVGTATLIDPLSGATTTLYKGHKVNGPMAWSPDSCCVSFSDENKNPIDAARIIVYRVRDGAWYVLMHLGPDGGTSAHFGWFYGYHEFLARNNPPSGKPVTQTSNPERQ